MSVAATPKVGLPPPRRDLARACADYDAVGIAVMAGVFSGAEMDEARATVAALAASERADGGAHIGPGPNQRVWGLVHKAPVFRRLVTHPSVLALAHHILGPRIMLYSMQAHLVPPGGDMDPHYDQSTFSPHVPFPVVAAVVVMLEDFTEANGATRIAVGGEARRVDEPAPAPEAMVPLIGEKGALAAYGGLLWHSTGVNRTPELRHGLLIHFCLPWIRQHENYQRTISAGVARGLTEEMRDLLGIHENEFGRRWRSAAPEFRPMIPSFDKD
jgi:ectoine hydroxylase-related dioxygenase (phytanoyl-CoA dioxygenase family)